MEGLYTIDANNPSLIKYYSEDLKGLVCSVPASEIACVVFSGKMLCLIPVNQNGEPVRSRTFIFTDARSAPQADRFLGQFGHERFYAITGGSQIPAIYPLFKIKWLQENEPQVYEAADKFLQAKGFVVYRLTGNFVTDYSDASQTGLFDLHRLRWSQEHNQRS